MSNGDLELEAIFGSDWYPSDYINIGVSSTYMLSLAIFTYDGKMEL